MGAGRLRRSGCRGAGRQRCGTGEGVVRKGREEVGLPLEEVEWRGRYWSSKISTSRFSGAESRVMALRVVSRDFAAVGEVGREAGRGMPSRVGRRLGVVGVGKMELRLACVVEDAASFFCFASHVCTVGWPQMVRV